MDPSLTQKAWGQFTEAAGLGTYFRPLLDARPLGKGAFEVSMLQWQTGIDDADAVYSTWASVSPYAGVSAYLSSAHETTAAVALSDEKALGFQAMAGAVVELSRARIGLEYNMAKVHSTSLKVGVRF